MTPSDLLARAKDHFPVLFHNEPEKLRGLVRDTLGVYEDVAGYLCRAYSPKDDLTVYSIDIPADFLAVAGLKDAMGQWHEFETDLTENKIVPVLQSGSRTPFAMDYFFNFRGMDVALSLEDYDADVPEYTAGDSAVRNSAGQQFLCVKTHDPAGLTEPADAAFDDTLWKKYNHIPQVCIGIMLDYLIAVINLHNTERERGVNASVGISKDLPSISELKEAVTAAKEAMGRAHMILPVFAVRGM